MATNSTSTTPSWHRPCHPSHGYLKHGYTILRSRLDWHRHKGTTWWSNLIGFTPATSSAMHRSLRLGRGDGVHRLTLGFFSCLTVCVATFVTVEGCWVLWLLENIGYIRICSNLSYTPSWSLYSYIYAHKAQAIHRTIPPIPSLPSNNTDTSCILEHD